MPRAGNRRRRARRAGKDARVRLEGVTHGSSRRFAWLRWVCPARWALESAPGGRANFELRGEACRKRAARANQRQDSFKLPRRTGASHRPVRGPWLLGGAARFGALVGAPRATRRACAPSTRRRATRRAKDARRSRSSPSCDPSRLGSDASRGPSTGAHGAVSRVLREHRGERADDDAQEERGEDARVGRGGSDRRVPAGLEWCGHPSIVARLGVRAPVAQLRTRLARWRAPVARRTLVRPPG